MSTVTAQILVGGAHPNDGGIIPGHVLFLGENSRPVWTLMNAMWDPYMKQDSGQVVWIPTIDHMLEDAFVMIGVYALQDEKLVKNFKELNLLERDRLELYDDATEEIRMHWYELAKQIELPHKVVITVLDGSTILYQLPCIRDYHFDVDVCTPKFSRYYSAWNDKVEIRGKLK